MKLSTTRRHVLMAALGAAGLSAIAVAPAGATGSYPGETLAVAQSGPAVVGHATNFVASGQQADVDSYAGGFNLEVFQKDPARDPTCSPSYTGEKSTYASELPAEKYIVVGQWEGMGTSFSVPFQAVFDKAGPELLCAYSSWIVDTAAAAQLTVNVTGGSSGGRPINVRKPHVTRSRQHLTCATGTWSNRPSSYGFGWLVDGRARKGAQGRTLSAGRGLRGHKVRCTVAARNRAGKTTATSASYTVR
jgi:hypothetical protein